MRGRRSENTRYTVDLLSRSPAQIVLLPILQLSPIASTSQDLIYLTSKK